MCVYCSGSHVFYKVDIEGKGEGEGGGMLFLCLGVCIQYRFRNFLSVIEILKLAALLDFLPANTSVCVYISGNQLFFFVSVEYTRVSLHPIEGVNGSDYINANYIAVS